MGVVDPGWIEKFVAATVKWIANILIIPAIFPGVPEIARFLLRTFYSIIGKDEEYDARVEEADKLFEAYLHDTAPGSTLTKEEWLEKEYSVTGAAYHATVKGISDMATSIGDWMFDRSTDKSTIKNGDLQWVVTKDLSDEQFVQEYMETLSSPRSLYNGMLMHNPASAEVYIRGCLIQGIDLITGRKLSGQDYANIRTVYSHAIAPNISLDEDEADYKAMLLKYDVTRLKSQNRVFTDIATGKRKVTELTGDLNAEFSGTNTSLPTTFDYSSGLSDEEFTRENYMNNFNDKDSAIRNAALENYKYLWRRAFETTGGFSDETKARDIENLYRAMSITKLHPMTRKPITEGDMAFIRFMYDVYANNLFDDKNYTKILKYMESFGGNLIYARRALEASAHNETLTKASTLAKALLPTETPQTGQGKFGMGNRDNIFPPYQITNTMKNISNYLTKQMAKMFGQFTEAAKPKIVEVEKPVAVPTPAYNPAKTPTLPVLPSEVFKQSNEAGDILDSLEDIEPTNSITDIGQLLSDQQNSLMSKFTGALSDLINLSPKQLNDKYNTTDTSSTEPETPNEPEEESLWDKIQDFASMPSAMRDRMLYGYNDEPITDQDDTAEGKYGKGPAEATTPTKEEPKQKIEPVTKPDDKSLIDKLKDKLSIAKEFISDKITTGKDIISNIINNIKTKLPTIKSTQTKDETTPKVEDINKLVTDAITPIDNKPEVNIPLLTQSNKDDEVISDIITNKKDITPLGDIDYRPYLIESNEKLQKIYDLIFEYINPEANSGVKIKNANPEQPIEPNTNTESSKDNTTNEETKDKVTNTPVTQAITEIAPGVPLPKLDTVVPPATPTPTNTLTESQQPTQPNIEQIVNPQQPTTVVPPIVPQQTAQQVTPNNNFDINKGLIQPILRGQNPLDILKSAALQYGSRAISNATNGKVNISAQDLGNDPLQALKNAGLQYGSEFISRTTGGRINVSAQDLGKDPLEALKNAGLQYGSKAILNATNGKVNISAQDLRNGNIREPLERAARNEASRRLNDFYSRTFGSFNNGYTTPGFLGRGKYGRGNEEPVEESGYIDAKQDWANTTVRWVADSAANPIVANLKTNVVKGLASTTKNVPVVGKVANAAANVVTSPFQLGAKIGEATRIADGTSSYMDLIKWFLNKVMTAMEKFFNLPFIQNTLVKLATALGHTKPMEFVSNFVSKMVNFVKSAVPKAAEKLGITEFLTTGARYTPTIGYALTAYDLIVGMDEAEYLLGIKNVTWVDQCIAGFVKAFCNYIVVPTLYPGLNETVRFIYRYLLGTKVANKYEEEVKKTDDEYKAYTANTSNPLSKADWLSQQFSVSGKISSTLGNLVFHPIDTISSWFAGDNKNIVEEKSHPITYQGMMFSTAELRTPPKLPEGTTVIGPDGQAHLSPELLNNPNEVVLRRYGIVPPSETGKGKGIEIKFGKGLYSKQIDPSIANIRYNTNADSEYQTIGDSGCGPAAAVNVVESMFGRGSRLLNAANYALQGGYKETNGGTKPKFFTDYFADNGLSSSTTSSKSTMIDRINSGQPTVLMGQDKKGVSPDTPYGTTQHYVTVTGTDGRGHAIVQDPESRYDNLLYDTDKLVSKSSLAVSAGEGKYGRGRNIQRGLEIRNYLMSKGIPEKAAYGMIGNIEQESHLDPTIVEYLLRNEYRQKDPNAYGINWKGKNYQKEYTAAIDSGKLPLSEFLYPHVSQEKNRKDYGKQARRGYGLVQFTSAGLKQDLYNNTVKKGISIGSLTGQLDAVLNMLKSSYKKLYATLTNPNIQTGDAAEAFVRQYERPAEVNKRAEERRRYAAEWEQALSGQKGGMPTADMQWQMQILQLQIILFLVVPILLLELIVVELHLRMQDLVMWKEE